MSAALSSHPDPVQTETWYRYVPHAARPTYEAAGWVFDADLGPVHGFWTVLMRWTGDGHPVDPPIVARIAA